MGSQGRDFLRDCVCFKYTAEVYSYPGCQCNYECIRGDSAENGSHCPDWQMDFKDDAYG